MWDHGVLHETALGYIPGALAGLAGGAAMLLAFAILSFLADSDPLWLPRRLAALLFGKTDIGNWAVGFGLVAHMGLSAGFGVLYAVVVTKLTHELWLTAGAYGLTLWVVNYWGGHLSSTGRAMVQKRPAWLSPIAHVAYGGFMALVAEAFASGVL